MSVHVKMSRRQMAVSSLDAFLADDQNAIITIWTIIFSYYIDFPTIYMQPMKKCEVTKPLKGKEVYSHRINEPD
jgi:hypothetical protein